MFKPRCYHNQRSNDLLYFKIITFDQLLLILCVLKTVYKINLQMEHARCGWT